MTGWTGMSGWGLAGYINRRGGGGNFPPQQVVEVVELLHQAPPVEAGETYPPSRWTLARLKRCCVWAACLTVAGFWRWLAAGRIRYKAGRQWVHSPDPDYLTKREQALQAVAAARLNPGSVVTLYLDELTYYRQPSLARAWEQQGAAHQPLARCSYRRNTKRRVVATLDTNTGQVVFHQASKVGIKALIAFYAKIRAAYPTAATIFVIQDNWPMHADERVLAAAQSQRITPLWLPTYAPWLNPIEKLWRKLKQEVLHLHRLSDAWEVLQTRVEAFLANFAQGSLALLRYVGLLPD